MSEKRTKPIMEKPNTYSANAVKSRHTPMWLYECCNCCGYASFSGIVIIGDVVYGCGTCECGGKFFPVFPNEITRFCPMSTAEDGVEYEIEYPEKQAVFRLNTC